jgi:hypothetical protein
MAFLALVDGAVRPLPAAIFGRHPSPAVRMRVRMHRPTPNRRLADGADPHTSPEPALRALQPTAPRERHACVAGLERLLREAAAPARPLTVQAPVQRAAILAARPSLLNVRRALRDAENPRPEGLARTVLLLMDGCGPLYAPSYPGAPASVAYRAAGTL